MRYISSYYPAGTASLPLVHPDSLIPAGPLGPAARAEPVGDGEPARPAGPFRGTFEPGAAPPATASASI
jgi:hypothetical protein